MRRSDRTYILGAVFATATALFYCVTRWSIVTLPRYYPVQHVWKWGKMPGAPSQGWYTAQLFAYLAAGLVTLAVYLALRLLRPADRPLRPGTLKGVGILATLVIAACLGYLVYNEVAG